MDPLTETAMADLPEAVLGAGVKMEVLFELIESTAAPVIAKLFRLFGNSSPNLYHHFLARLLEKKATSHVVTTNFDRLIERASRSNLDVSVTEQEHSRRPLCGLYKIHGSVDRPDSIIAVVEQVSRGLGPQKRQLMKEILSQTCLVVGWSDDDIDLSPAFFEFASGLLIWFIYDPQSSQVVDFMR